MAIRRGSITRSIGRTDIDVDALVTGYEAREPRYTERDFMLRWSQIKSARAIGVEGGPAAMPPSDRMVALLASGRVSDAEYFRLAGLLGVDATGLIHAEPPVDRSFVERLAVAWGAFASFLSRLRRAGRSD